MSREQAVSYFDFGGGRGAAAVPGLLLVRGALGATTVGGVQVQAQVTLQPNTLDVNGMALRFTMLGNSLGTGASKTMSILFGGTTIASVNTAVPTDTILRLNAILIRRTTNVQVAYATEGIAPSAGAAVLTDRLTFPAIDLSAAVTIVFQTNVPVPGDLKTELCMVEAFPVCTTEQ